MRSIPSALQTKLDSGITTLARCWVLTRRDGVVQGFTDHDADIVVAAVTCRAGTGFTASEATSRFDLSVPDTEISGALSDTSLTEADLAAGRYDAAKVETWLVDWSEPDLRVLTARGALGEVKREGAAFTAELRGLADLLAQESGRFYTATCSADLGDPRCGIDLTDAVYRGTGAVSTVTGASQFIASGLDGFIATWFSAGRLTWTTGGNVGVSVEIKQHRVEGGHAVLSLWQTMAEPLGVGDAFAVTAGCDKRLSTCRARFANAINFRGFPHIPGNDFVMSYPKPGGGDGTSGATYGSAYD